MPRPVVAVVGAGFSGLLTTLNILRLDPDVQVRLIEKRGVFGLGPAYATANPKHLLNVRLGHMSAFPDQQHHLTDWMARQTSWSARDDFISRGTYGQYLAHLLEEVTQDESRKNRLSLVSGAVAGIRPEGAGWRLALDGREPLAADAVVLAQGNLNPASPAGLEPGLGRSGRYIANPWDAAETVPPHAHNILLIGAGLTMVDVALTLKGPGRRFSAISRRGLLPRSHGSSQVPPPSRSFSGGPAQVLRQARAAMAGEDWRAVVDDVRHSARSLWASWSPVERGRFLRHLRALWENHRHRLAPGVAREVAAMLTDESLTIEAGHVLGLRQAPHGVAVDIRPRGERTPGPRLFDAVVNCSGPAEDVSQSPDPLIRDLLAQGQVAAAPLGLGLAIDEAGRLKNAAGSAQARLFAVGPLTRSLFWEASAVPDLRHQALFIAQGVLASLERPVTAHDRAIEAVSFS